MSLRINDIAPDFTAESTQGPIHFHEWIGDGWAVLFSHPKDFTPVCTTELGAVAALQEQFAERGAKVIGLSVDPVSNHSKWTADIQDVGGFAVNYPLIGDPELKIAKLYDMLPADAGDTFSTSAPWDRSRRTRPGCRPRDSTTLDSRTASGTPQCAGCGRPSGTAQRSRDRDRSRQALRHIVLRNQLSADVGDLVLEGSRTSRMNTSSPASMRFFSSFTVICGIPFFTLASSFGSPARCRRTADSR
jgi:peroxiredoxin